MSQADEILKLKELLDSGALTQEEFDAQKKKILNSDKKEDPNDIVIEQGGTICKKKLRLSGNLIWDIISAVLLIVAYVGLFLPAATFKDDNAIIREFKCYKLLTGAKYRWGEIVITPSYILWISVLLSVVTAVLLILWGRAKEKLTSIIQAITSIIGFVVPIALAFMKGQTFASLRIIKIGSGIYVIAFIQLVVVVISLIKLYENKV